MKIILSSILLVALIAILIIMPVFNIKNTMIEHDVYSESKKVQEAFQNYDAIECKFGLLNPEYAFVSHLHYVYPERNIDTVTLRIDFYNLNRPNILSRKWNIQRTGGTDVKNTTFPELVKMVKEDCSQFQQGGRQGEMEWIYSPAPTQEETDKDKIERLDDRFSGYGDETKKAFIEVYGDIAQMSDKEKILLFDRIETEGLEASVDKTWQVDILLEDLAYMTESQRAAIRKRYGDWKGMSVDELFEWGTKLGQDIEEGKFNPDDY